MQPWNIHGHGKILAITLIAAVFLASPDRSSAVPISVHDGSLTRVNWDQCIQRAIRALQSEGWRNVRGPAARGSARTVFVGGQHSTYSGFILCRPLGSGGSTYTIVVAAPDGVNTRVVRDRLLRIMKSAAEGGTGDLTRAVGLPCAEDRTFVTSLYWSILGRQPDAAGLNYWVDRLGSGKARTWVIGQFFRTAEYRSFDKSNEDFIRDAYQSIYGREPEPTGRSYWLRRLGDDLSRDGMIQAFFRTWEYPNITVKCSNN